MPKNVNLLPTGVTLAPGTPVEISHSDTISHIVYEIAPVCDDGISVRSSLNPKQLEGCIRTNWKVCVTNLEGKESQYYAQVRTEDVKAEKLIRLCNKQVAQLMGMFYGTYARTYKPQKYYKKHVSKMFVPDNPIPDDSPNKTNTAKCLEDFLKSELKHMPRYYAIGAHPCPVDFQELTNFITPPQEEEASTSAAARMSSMLEEIMEAETTPTND